MAEDSSQNTMKLSGTEKVPEWTDYLTPGNISIIAPPVFTWKCILHTGTWWMIEEGKQPNWFNRKMQELCFGFKWEKNETV